MSLRNKRNTRKLIPDAPDVIPARLGDGFGNVFVPNQPNMCYLRVGGMAQIAFNTSTPYTNDLDVDCSRDTTRTSERPGIYRVISTRTRNPGGLTGGAVSLTFEAIAKALEYMAIGGGQAPLWVQGMQIIPLRVGQYAGLLIQVQPGFIAAGTVDIFIPFTAIDLSALLPTAAGKAALVLISVKTDGTLIATKGAEFDLASMTTPALLLANRPAAPALTARELSLVRVYTGQTSIQEARVNTDFFDLRDTRTIFTSSIPAGSITLAQMADEPAATVIGRASGAGTGVPVYLTDAQIATILHGSFTGGGTVATGGFTGTIPGTGTFAMLNAANAFTLINPITTIAESWIGPSSTTGVYFKNGFVGIGNTNPTSRLHINASSTDETTTLYGNRMTIAKTSANADSKSNAALYASFFLAGSQNYTGNNAGAFYESYHQGTGLASNILGMQATVGSLVNGGNITNAIVYDATSFGSGAGVIGTTIGYRVSNLNASNSPTTTKGMQISANTAATGTNKIGIDILNISGAATLNLAIRTAAGLVNFGDQVSTLGSADRIQQIVKAFSTQTTTLFQTQDSTTAVTNQISNAPTTGATALETVFNETGAPLLDWRAESDTEPNMVFIDSSADKLYLGGTTNAMTVDKAGVQKFVGTGYTPYASMHGDDIAEAVTIAAANTYYQVNASISAGVVSAAFTFQNARELKCNVAGTYQIVWGMSISSGNNKHIEGSIMINTTAHDEFGGAAHTPGSGDEVHVGGAGFVALAVNDLVKFCVENESDTSTITVHHANMSILMVGG